MQHATEPGSDQNTDTLRIKRPSPGVLLIVLVFAIFVLVVLDTIPVGVGRETGERLAINGQFSVAAWWASMQLLFLSVLLSIVALREFRAARRAPAVTLGIGAAVAVFWSVDKITDFKETITGTLQAREALPSLNDGPTISVFVGALIALAILSLVLPGIVQLFRTEPTTVLAVTIGGAMNLFGSTAVEAFIRTESTTRIATEEAVEFLGIALMVWAVYRMLGTTELRLHRP